MPPSRRKPAAPAPTGELALIDRIRRRAATLPVTRELRLGIGDDCAILRPRPGEEILVTTDLSLETRHFRRDWHTPEAIGHRTLARGLSDLAAMGARPVAAFLSLALPVTLARQTADSTWLDRFLDGLLTLAARTRTPLAGGDTSQSPTDHVLADIVLLGAAPRGRALRRSGARPGDRLFCTGTLGGSVTELASLSSAPPAELTPHPLPTEAPEQPNPHPHLFPEPRLAIGQTLLRRHLASAAMDLSDGLSTDLRHLCQASGVAAEILASQLPLHPLRASLSPEAALAQALHGGEDYELLFTAPPTARVPKRLHGTPITEIGRILPPNPREPLITLRDANGLITELQPGGWEHLR